MFLWDCLEFQRHRLLENKLCPEVLQSVLRAEVEGDSEVS